LRFKKCLQSLRVWSIMNLSCTCRQNMTTDTKENGKPPNSSKDEFISILQLRFAHINQTDTLKVYGVKDDLLNYCANSNDRKYGYTKLPDERFRLKDQEIAGQKELEEEKEEIL